MQRFVLALALAATLVGSTSLAAQTDSESSQAIVDELSRLNATLAELKELMARQLEAQSLDLMLKRTELASQEASQLEARLRTAESRVRSLEDERTSMQSQLQVMTERARDQGIEVTEETRVYVQRFEAEMERVERRLVEAQADVMGITGRLDRKLEDLRAWQDLIDRRLSSQ